MRECQHDLMSATTIASYGRNGQKDVCFSRMRKKSSSYLVRLVCSVCLVYPVCLVRERQIDMIDQTDPLDRPGLAQKCRPSKFWLAEIVFPQPVRPGKRMEISSAFDWRGRADSGKRLVLSPPDRWTTSLVSLSTFVAGLGKARCHILVAVIVVWSAPLAATTLGGFR
jgi:hypothetical protein